MNEPILQTILRILSERLGQDSTVLVPKNFDESLTGPIFMLTGYEMVYLYCFVTESFQIQIPAEDLIDYRFSTVRKIYDVVEKHLEIKA